MDQTRITMASTAQGLPYNLVVVIYEIKQLVWIGHHHSKAGAKPGLVLPSSSTRLS